MGCKVHGVGELDQGNVVGVGVGIVGGVGDYSNGDWYVPVYQGGFSAMFYWFLLFDCLCDFVCLALFVLVVIAEGNVFHRTI